MPAVLRFSTDPHLDQRAARRLYSKWLADGLDGRADFVKVATNGDKPSGFVLCRKFVDHVARIPGDRFVPLSVATSVGYRFHSGEVGFRLWLGD